MPQYINGNFFDIFLDESFPIGIVIGGHRGFNLLGITWLEFLDRIEPKLQQNIKSGQVQNLLDNIEESDAELFGNKVKANPYAIKSIRETLHFSNENHDPFAANKSFLINRLNGLPQYLHFISSNNDILFDKLDSYIKICLPINVSQRVIILFGDDINYSENILRHYNEILTNIASLNRVSITAVSLNKNVINFLNDL